MADILDYCSDLAEVRFKSGQIMLPEGERLGKLLVLIEAILNAVQKFFWECHDVVGAVDDAGSFGIIIAHLQFGVA